MNSGECVTGDGRPDSIGDLLSPEEGHKTTTRLLVDLNARSVRDLQNRTRYSPEEIIGAFRLNETKPVIDFSMLKDYPR